MKKGILSITALALFSAALLFSGCGKDDTVDPTIDLLGSTTEVVQYKSTSTYTDPGFTANDDNDGDITSSVTTTGTVDMNSAGEYTIEYTVADKAGNTTTVTRTVIVDAAAYVAGSYNHVDTEDGTVYPSVGPESIIVSSVTKNRIVFGKFTDRVNATPYAILSGSTITIPSQTFVCGTDAVSRTFASTGTCTFTQTGFTINYTITVGGATIAGSSVYSRI